MRIVSVADCGVRAATNDTASAGASDAALVALHISFTMTITVSLLVVCPRLLVPCVLYCVRDQMFYSLTSIA